MRKVARISQTHPAMSSVGGHAMPSTGTVGGARGVGGAAAVAAAAAAAALKASTALVMIASLQPLCHDCMQLPQGSACKALD